MKSIITIFIIFITIIKVNSQETFLKQYMIYNGSCNFSLMELKSVKYEDLDLIQQHKIRDKFILGKVITYSEQETIGGKEVMVNKIDTVNNSFFKKQKMNLSVKTKDIILNRAHVKLKGDKLYVNPIGSEKAYFYQLTSGQQFRLKFSEWSVSALTVPIKYRFKQKGIDEDFSTAINFNMFIGRSFGKTNFMYRKEVDNKINNWKISGGVIIGASTITLVKDNTSEFIGNKEFNKGLFSIGFGGAYSFNNINFGLFYGWDYGIGKSADTWNYNKKPWLGIAIGYSILKF